MNRSGLSDTDPRIERMLIEAYGRMTPAQKLHKVASLTRTTWMLAEARIRAQYPKATEHEVRLRRAALYLPQDLMVAAYGWDPDVQGR